MFGKFMKKRSEQDNVVPVDEALKNPSTKIKKKWNNADIVLVGGLVLIVGGMFWMMSDSNGTETSTIKPVKVSTKKPEPKTPFYKKNNVIVAKKPMPSSTTNTSEQVEESPPFVYAQKADFANGALMPPPEAYEQNNTLLAKKSPPLKKPSIPIEAQKVSEQNAEVIQEPITQKTKPKKIAQKPITIAPPPNVSYVCSIVDMYKDMIGREIMYYVKDATNHKYLPAYTQANWDEAGVWVKEKFIASQVDVGERMAEVFPNKWIPALEFMTCTMIQDGGR